MNPPDAASLGAPAANSHADTPKDDGAGGGTWEKAQHITTFLGSLAVLGVGSGFLLVLAYALDVGRFPRFALSDVTYSLVALSLVGLALLLLLWLTFTVPAKLASLSSDSKPGDENAPRLAAGFLFFGLTIAAWHIAFASSLAADKPKPTPVNIIVYELAVGLCIATFAYCVAQLVIQKSGLKKLSSKWLTPLNVAIGVTIASLLLAYFTDTSGSAPSREEALVLFEITGALWVIMLAAELWDRRSKQPDSKTCPISLPEVIWSGVMVVPAVTIIQSAVGGSITALAVLYLYLAIAAANAWIAFPLKKLSSTASAAVLGGCVGLSLLALALPLSRTAIKLLGFGNQEVAYFSMTKEDFEANEPPTGVRLKKEEFGKYYRIRNVHLVHDIGTETVFRLPIEHSTRQVLWVVPHDTVHGMLVVTEGPQPSKH